MRFFSTRNEKNTSTFKEAVLKGIADEGGLYVPEHFPRIDLPKLLEMDYMEMAHGILSCFTDLSEEELWTSIKDAYKKFPLIPAPLRKTSDLYYLELYHGPTLAFKDFALSILPKFMEYSIKSLTPDSKVLILTATSGDTGSAALEGFSGLSGIDIGVFFPQEGISQIQKLQMVTNPASNTFVAGIKGNFDDAQSAVKEIFTDAEFIAKLEADGINLSSANSINIGRLLPQIVYYFYAYKEMVVSEQIALGDHVSFSVPTGNFGDILAGYYAKEMGLPINKFLVASNENKVLTDFFTTGVYDKNRNLKVTNSPSMDIIVSSNLERLLYHKTKDAALVARLQDSLKTTGKFELKADFSEFHPGFCNQDDTLATIRKVYEEDGYLIDTHTAVAANVAKMYLSSGASEKIIVLSTASPYKFSDSIMEALELTKLADPFDNLMLIEAATGLTVPSQLLDLKKAKINHNTVIEKDEIKNTVEKFIGDRNEG